MPQALNAKEVPMKFRDFLQIPLTIVLKSCNMVGSKVQATPPAPEIEGAGPQ
jgi:hypothetical protein